MARFFKSIVDTTSDIEGLGIVLCIDDDDIESQKISDHRIGVKTAALDRMPARMAEPDQDHRASSVNA